jgi:MFS family permease
LLLGIGLTDAQFHEWGWRLPFLASAVLVGLGLWVRLSLTETPAFVEAAEKAPPPRVPLGELLREHSLPTAAATVGTVACFALFYIATVFVIGYGTKVLGYDRQTFLLMELGGIVFMAAGILIAGHYSDKSSGGRVLAWGFIVTIPVGLTMATLLVGHSLPSVFVWLVFALFTMGFAYGPLGGWLPSLFPARVRYTGVSVAFNVGGILGGGLTPLLAEKLSRGGLDVVGLCLAGAGAVSLVGLALTRKRGAA